MHDKIYRFKNNFISWTYDLDMNFVVRFRHMLYNFSKYMAKKFIHGYKKNEIKKYNILRKTWVLNGHLVICSV